MTTSVIGSRAESFKRPLLSFTRRACMSVCLSATWC